MAHRVLYMSNKEYGVAMSWLLTPLFHWSTNGPTKLQTLHTSPNNLDHPSGCLSFQCFSWLFHSSPTFVAHMFIYVSTISVFPNHFPRFFNHHNIFPFPILPIVSKQFCPRFPHIFQGFFLSRVPTEILLGVGSCDSAGHPCFFNPPVWIIQWFNAF